jgi:hypothetical protein
VEKILCGLRGFLCELCGQKAFNRQARKGFAKERKDFKTKDTSVVEAADGFFLASTCPPEPSPSGMPVQP